MINQNFVILGAIIAAIGSLSYLIDTVKGKVKPNRVSLVELSLYHENPCRTIYQLVEKPSGEAHQ
jgi:hypothetical protein